MPGKGINNVFFFSPRRGYINVYRKEEEERQLGKSVGAGFLSRGILSCPFQAK